MNIINFSNLGGMDMLKKSLLLTVALGLVTSMFVGCSSGATPADKKKDLVISTFGLNEDKLNENVFKPFEEEHGVKIVLETGNNADRLTKLKNNPKSTVDLIYLAESYAAQGIEAGLFEKIDYSKIPNSENIIDKGKVTVEEGFGPAYTLNSIGIAVNPNKIDFEITSFEDLWRPELKGKIAIPDITTTFGPAMVYIAAQKAGVDVSKDNGAAAFKELEKLKPNVVKTYSKSSDLANMFASGEITVAVTADFAYGMITNASPDIKLITPQEGRYLNFNSVNINKNSENKELAYEFLDYLLSEEVQNKTAKNLSESPINKKVSLTDEESKNLTYGSTAENAKTIDFKVVNKLMSEWIDTWNRTMN
jgi:putative spermidine/putrescine transport system substrate-binding protein